VSEREVAKRARRWGVGRLVGGRTLSRCVPRLCDMMRHALTTYLGIASFAASVVAEAGPGISSNDAATYLIKRFDFYGHTGPNTPPDGEWHYNELAQYANASKRPEGEPLEVTASNLMVLMDTDRNSSVTKDELTAFLEHVRDRRGLNGEEGRQRAAARQAKAEADLNELKEKQAGDGEKHGVGKDGKTWFFGDGPEVNKAEKYMHRASSERTTGHAHAEAANKKRRKTRASRKRHAKKDEL